MRLRRCLITCEPKDLDENAFKYLEYYSKKEIGVIDKWAFILHNDAIEIRPHYHIYVHFGKYAFNNDRIIEIFGVPTKCVEIISGSFKDVLNYMLCQDKNYPECYRYSLNQIVRNFDLRK